MGLGPSTLVFHHGATSDSRFGQELAKNLTEALGTLRQGIRDRDHHNRLKPLQSTML